MGVYLWVSLLAFLKSIPNMPELPDGEYPQTFLLAHQAQGGLRVSKVMASFIFPGAVQKNKP